MKGFSFAIFLVMFITLSILSVCLSGGYFYLGGKRAVEEATENTRIYSLPLAEAVSDIAASCHEKKEYSRLKALFESDIFKKNIKEVFFVLADGRIIAHSDIDRLGKLNGNLSNDKKAYNTQKIFLPLKSKSADAQFLDYNISDVKIPFKKDKLKLLSGYINNKLEFTGWLVSKAVTIKGNGAGCVCFLIEKGRLYKSFEQIYKDAIYLLVVLFFISLLIASMVAVSVYVRYNSMTAGNISVDLFSSGDNATVKDAVRVVDPSKPAEQVKISSWEMTVPVAENDEKELNIDSSKIIKDAIPVSGE